MIGKEKIWICSVVRGDTNQGVGDEYPARKLSTGMKAFRIGGKVNHSTDLPNHSGEKKGKGGAGRGGKKSSGGGGGKKGGGWSHHRSKPM